MQIPCLSKRKVISLTDHIRTSIDRLFSHVSNNYPIIHFLVMKPLLSVRLTYLEFTHFFIARLNPSYKDIPKTCIIITISISLWFLCFVLTIENRSTMNISQSLFSLLMMSTCVIERRHFFSSTTDNKQFFCLWHQTQFKFVKATPNKKLNRTISKIRVTIFHPTVQYKFQER